MTHVAVIGATGFVGSASAEALEARGARVSRIRAPRLPEMGVTDGPEFIASRPQELSELTESLRDADAVINAAGVADASSSERSTLVAANGVLPGLIGAAAREAGLGRFVHISSAAVQGRRPALDATDNYDAFSPYSSSKVLGERLAREFGGSATVVYRPPGVHGADRPVTRSLVRVARSPLSSVARPGSRPTPQALIGNVADAVAFLAMTSAVPPPTVIHPWEGLSTADLLELLGGRRPLEIPYSLATTGVRTLGLLGAVVPAAAANARRAEMLWLGQRQARSWLTDAGWEPPVDRSAWTALGDAVRDHSTITNE